MYLHGSQPRPDLVKLCTCIAPASWHSHPPQPFAMEAPRGGKGGELITIWFTEGQLRMPLFRLLQVIRDAVLGGRWVESLGL